MKNNTQKSDSIVPEVVGFVIMCVLFALFVLIVGGDMRFGI